MQTNLTGRELDAAVSRVVYGETWRGKGIDGPPVPRHDPLQVIEDLRQRGLFLCVAASRQGFFLEHWNANSPDATNDHIPWEPLTGTVPFADLRETILRAAVRLCS